jgi:predicted DNA-binding protein YlxM (UPF0122 family)
MITGDINNYIRKEVPEKLQRLPHTLNQEQEKLVIMITQEMIQTILDKIQTEFQDTENKKELDKIKTVWKKFNELLK